MSDDFNLDIIQNDAELEKLCTDSVELINYARNIVVNHVNIVQIMTYYSLGRWIVETQQMGEKRAKYGSKVIKTLSEKLQKEFGKGFSEDTLKNARKFYLTYKERISETVFSLFAIEKSETVFSLFEKEPPFIVSWSHYLQLMRIENEAERSFYEIESAKTGWGVRTLQRQYNSSLYERLALSKDAILVCAWNKERFVNALLNIGQNVGNLFEYDKINHMATYIYPIGLTIVYNGNHSTLSGILK